MGKHAFLVIAHNEFEVLQVLIDALDDEDFDFFVHIDTKVKHLPTLASFKSRLVIMPNRVDVIWGHVSQIRCEIELMEFALKSNREYEYYHIISGTHFPLVNPTGIKKYFKEHHGSSVVQLLPSSEVEKRFRFGYYHYFMKYYLCGPKYLNKSYRFLWKVNLFIQKRQKIERDISYIKEKSSNWCALTREAVCKICSQKEEILSRFKRTFCGDEYFTVSVLENNQLKYDIVSNMLYQEFSYGNPRFLTIEDYDVIRASNCLFARKISSKNMSLITKLCEDLRQNYQEKNG